mgnify:CR=1 FL=1
MPIVGPMAYVTPILLLVASNVFMTLAWYGHLNYKSKPLILVIVLGAIGVANVGTVFAAALLKVRSRDVLLPVILYPLLVPLFVAGTKTTVMSHRGGRRYRSTRPMTTESSR